MIEEIIRQIMDEADKVIRVRIDEVLKIDYVAIFPVSEDEKNALEREIKILGRLVEKTTTGKTYFLNERVDTKYGSLRLVKIRVFDPNKNRRGAPDFKVESYQRFKEKHMHSSGFQLISRGAYEMIELDMKGSNVLLYFPNETLSESLKLG